MSVDRVEEVEGGESKSATTAAAATTTAVHYYSVAPGYRLNVRRGPGTQYGIVRVLPEGAQVAIYCQTPGTSVVGPYGTSNIWDNIANGEFVSDAYVLTGSDGYVASRCG
ncbi:SH3 domain-containing protein [Streptomyces canus]|uniref:SH3 domain-containing protein n=1 Tax=Streptomyces canus TaxID=58343 RepID=UPI002251CE0D|nr:SH3 domain-containing protein [Streptomyces canus]MCX4858046.1 SH3 domain-containing protein [Streptomyces canus]